MEIKVGLIAGRHEMPVDEYIFNAIENPMAFTTMDKIVVDWFKDNLDIGVTNGRAINSASYTDDEVWQSQSRLVLYVTGLTAATATVIKQAAFNGVPLTLMHYDSKSGGYQPQLIF